MGRRLNGHQAILFLSVMLLTIRSNPGSSFFKWPQFLTSEFSSVCELSRNWAVDKFATGQLDGAVFTKVAHPTLELCGGDAHVCHRSCFTCNINTIMYAMHFTVFFSLFYTNHNRHCDQWLVIDVLISKLHILFHCTAYTFQAGGCKDIPNTPL